MQPTKIARFKPQNVRVEGTPASHGTPRAVELSRYEDGDFMVTIFTSNQSLKCVVSPESAKKMAEFLAPPTGRKQVTVNVDLYKPSGKWAYGFKSTFDQPDGYIDDERLLFLISVNQDQVGPRAVTHGDYTAVIKETEECMNDPEYKGFLCRMIPARSE